jgi:hypothetical protein
MAQNLLRAINNYTHRQENARRQSSCQRNEEVKREAVGWILLVQALASTVAILGVP